MVIAAGRLLLANILCSKLALDVIEEATSSVFPPPLKFPLVGFREAFPASPDMSKPFEMLNRFANYVGAAPVGSTLQDRDLKKSERPAEVPSPPSRKRRIALPAR